MKKQYDLVIVGGAMSGCCLALAIAQHLPELSIAIIERQKNTPHSPTVASNVTCGFDARSIALAQGSCHKLHHIAYNATQSLWQKIEPLAETISQIHISDQGHSGIVDLGTRTKLKSFRRCGRTVSNGEYLTGSDCATAEY